LNSYPEDVSALLVAWNEGDSSALDKLMPLLYEELRRLAHGYMRRERPDHLLQTTALVHEAYLRMVDQKRTCWQNRAQFFGVAAQLVRRILVDDARKSQSSKRGGNAQRMPLDEAAQVGPERGAELVSLDHAMQSLAEVDLRKSQIVELRYFGGLTVEETAEFLKISEATVMRDWSLAKAWLYRELHHER
jgi:RNA polymerase sigma factor (TIGR02999 family)